MSIFLSSASIIAGLIFSKLCSLEKFKFKNLNKIKKVKTKVVFSEVIPNGDDDSYPVYYNKYEFMCKGNKNNISDISNKKLQLGDEYSFYVIKKKNKYEIINIEDKNRKVKNLLYSIFFFSIGILSIISKIYPTIKPMIDNFIFIPGSILIVATIITQIVISSIINKINNRDTELIEAKVIDFEIHYNDDSKVWNPVCEYKKDGKIERYTSKFFDSHSNYKKWDRVKINIPKQLITTNWLSPLVNYPKGYNWV